MASTRRRTVSIAADRASIDALPEARLGGRDRDAAALTFRDIDILSGGAEQRIAERLHHQLQRLERSLAVLGLGNAHLHGIAGDADCAHPDLGLAQAPSRVVAQGIEPILADVVDFHRQQQVSAAPKVEAQVELLARERMPATSPPCSAEKKLGMTMMRPSRQMARIVICFQRVNVSMLDLLSRTEFYRVPAGPMRLRRVPWRARP